MIPNSSTNTELPIAIVGAGPVGLAAAAHLVSRGLRPLVLEAGDDVAASVRSWGHVRLFSAWRYDVDRASASLLEPHGWVAPSPDEHPTGKDLVDRYLRPLAKVPALAEAIRFDSTVVSIGRRDVAKVTTRGREASPFVLRVRSSDGTEHEVLARAVIDASGTWRTPNPLGASGFEARGEVSARELIAYGIPDVLGADRARYAGRTTLVVGAGHSAANTILALVELAAAEPDTRVVWATRGSDLTRVFGGGDADGLPERGRLGARLRELVESGGLRLVSRFRTDEVALGSSSLVVRGTTDGSPVELEGIDRIVAATGQRPDGSIARELRTEVDSALESVRALAPLIDPNEHSCGTVRPHGEAELRQPEANYYVVGAKSYGRAPTFLLATGYEQVRSIVAAIAGDFEAARRVELDLPETGVCSSTPSLAGGDCCGAAPAEAVARPAPVSAPAGGCCPSAAPAAGGSKSSCC